MERSKIYYGGHIDEVLLDSASVFKASDDTDCTSGKTPPRIDDGCLPVRRAHGRDRTGYNLKRGLSAGDPSNLPHIRVESCVRNRLKLPGGVDHRVPSDPEL